MPMFATDAVSMVQVVHNEVIDTAYAVEAPSNAVEAGFSDLFESTVATSYYQIHIPTMLGGRSRLADILSPPSRLTSCGTTSCLSPNEPPQKNG
jgi:hypothetical protein